MDSQRNNKDNIKDVKNATIELIPRALEKLTSELEILTARRAKKQVPAQVTLRRIERKLKRIAPIANELDTLRNAPFTPRLVARRYQLLNSWLRLVVPKIPEGVEPVDYVIQEVRGLTKMPTLDLPAELDYETKHLGLESFVCDVVSSVDPAELNAFLTAGFTERHLVSQYQRCYSKAMLPKELQRYPRRLSDQWVEKLKRALRDVTADWESLLNQLYGLILLKDGKCPSWTEIRKVSLWDKVTVVRNDQRLVTFAKKEWVTVRNSLAHGRAFFHPGKGSVEFFDRARIVSWSPDQAFFEGIDIFLANLAMMGTWNFVHLARLKSFEAQITVLKQFIGANTNFRTCV